MIYEGTSTENEGGKFPICQRLKTVPKFGKSVQSGRINWSGNMVGLLDLMNENSRILIKYFGLIDKILILPWGKSKVI